MQTSWLTIVLFIFAASRIQGQVSPSGPLASAGQATNQAQDTPYVVVECGANQRVWEQLTYETLPSGQVVTNVHRYTEMASGLNHHTLGETTGYPFWLTDINHTFLVHMDHHDCVTWA